MILDLKFEGKSVFVIGGGKEGYRKTLSFLDAGAKILVIIRSFSRSINCIARAHDIADTGESLRLVNTYLKKQGGFLRFGL